MTQKVSSARRLSSGIPGLDDILGGGFPKGQMYLVTGDPGAGKTTIGIQFLREGIRNGERCVYVVLSESHKALRRLAASHGWDLQGMEIIDVSDQGAEEEYTLYHPAEVELGRTSKSLLQQLRTLQPDRLVMDSLSEVRLLAQDPLRYRRQLLALRHFFDESGATVLLMDFSTGSDDRQLESLCHGIVRLEQLAPEYGGQRRRLRVTKLRESSFRDGYHDFRIRTGGLRVFPRLVAAEHHRQAFFHQETVSSHVPELDALLGGGLDRGTTTLVLGHAGVGKSTLTAQFAKAAVDRGEKVAFFIFDEVPNTVIVRGESMGMEVRRHIEEERILLRQVDPAEMTPGQFTWMVREAVTDHGATMVVIDSVNGYQSAMPEEHFLHAHLHELLAYLNQERVVTMLVMTQTGVVGTHSPIDISYLADSVILLRYFEAAGQIRQAISVLKRRTGPHERTIREMTIDRTGVRIGRPLSDFQGIMSGQLTYTGATRLLHVDHPDGAGRLVEDGHGTP